MKKKEKSGPPATHQVSAVCGNLFVDRRSGHVLSIVRSCTRMSFGFNPRPFLVGARPPPLHYTNQFKNDYFAETCSGSEKGSHLRLINFCITQL